MPKKKPTEKKMSTEESIDREKVAPQIDEPYIDQKMSQLLAEMGQLQAEYQQLNKTSKSLFLRKAKKNFLARFRDWK